MLGSRRIGQRLQLVIGSVAAAILIATLWSTYRASRAQLDADTTARALTALRAAAREIDDFVLRVGMIPRSLAIRQQIAGEDPDEGLADYLRQTIERTPPEELYGAYVTFEDKVWSSPDAEVWVDRESWPGLQKIDYDYHDEKWEWYNGPKASGTFHVSEPYFDAGGSNITMVSLTAPMVGDGGRFLGVAGADLSLDLIRDIVRRIHLGLHQQRDGMDASDADFAYLISRSGRVLVHPDPGLMLRQGFDGAAAASLPEGGVVAATAEGDTKIGAGAERRHLFWRTSDLTGWKLVLSVSEREALRPARLLTLRSAAIGAAGLTAMISLVTLIAARISRPIGQLARASGELASGDYSGASVDPLTPRADELGELARGFKSMAGEIRAREARLEAWNHGLEKIVEQRTAELAHAVETAQQARERAEAANRELHDELAEAARYVRSILPDPTDHPFGVDWLYRPSAELGGDAFGYHWIDRDHFAIYLLDVSGHGVGAALLSVTAINVLRSGSLLDVDWRDPAAVLAALNASFPMEQHDNMYFTLWYGVYRASTRTLCYANGGHPPALLLIGGASDGPMDSIRLHSIGLAVGAMEEAAYRSEERPVPPGARLLVPCDGCYEIRRPDGTVASFEDLEAFLEARSAAPDALRELYQWALAEHGAAGLDDDFSIVRVAF